MTMNQITSLAQLTFAINDCLDKQQIMPCLILLYSGLEIVSRMASKPNEATSAYFMSWVDKYVLNRDQFDVTSVDLYAARCGVLHAFSPDSDKFRKGRARRIAYSWGEAKVEQLRYAIGTTSHDLAALDLNVFVRAFMTGIADFMDDLEKDPIAEQRAEAVRNEWFYNLQITKTS